MSCAINAADPFIRPLYSLLPPFIEFFLDEPRVLEDIASSLRRIGKLHEEANGLRIRL